MSVGALDQEVAAQKFATRIVKENLDDWFYLQAKQVDKGGLGIVNKLQSWDGTWTALKIQAFQFQQAAQKCQKISHHMTSLSH